MENEVVLSERDFDTLPVKYGDEYRCNDRKDAWGVYKYLLIDMEDIRKSFIRLGFHLKEMQNHRYYEDFGYQTLEDFAVANLGMDKSNVYRYIRVFEKFACPAEVTYDSGLASVSPKYVLNDKWKDYSYSQLVEMCNMSSDQREVCTPDMTIKQLREIKKAVTEYTTFEQAENIAKRILEGATATDLKDPLEQLDQLLQKVATSPQKGRSKEFSYDYYIGLHGAARAAYLKSRKAIDGAEIIIYDCEGKRLKLEPLALNQPLDLLYCKDGNYIFRLKSSSEQPDRSASSP